MKILRALLGLTTLDKIRNTEIRKRLNVKIWFKKFKKAK
jgi:hypothetical protein